VIGQAIKSVPRDRLGITSKASTAEYGTWTPFPPECSSSTPLRRRSTGTREKEKGKLRFVGIIEAAPFDLEHKMYQRALAEDDVWDTAIVAFNMMHRNARVSVFPKTRGKKVGTLLLFAVRGIFARPERLNAKARSPVADGQLPKWLGDSPDPLCFLVHKGGASSIIDEAYRFVRDEPGVDVVLFGTSDPDHLREDIASLSKPPLPAEDRQRIVTLFSNLLIGAVAGEGGAWSAE